MMGIASVMLWQYRFILIGVIPGRPSGAEANPESSNHRVDFNWIPGS
jgi:hypothetical protein